MQRFQPRTMSLALLLCAAAGSLSSCNLMRKNYTVMADRVAPAQADDVIVESRGDLPQVAPAVAHAPMPAAGAPKPSPAATGGRVVTVQPGDTLSGIARRNGTSVAAICEANGITPSMPIRPGQQLRLAGGGGAPAPAARSITAPRTTPPARGGTRSYTVKRGDTISGIAARYRVSSAALLRANNMTPQQADRIREGQTLRIPAAAR